MASVWQPEAIEFLRELERNNDREWFKANRGRYDEYVREPARELADSLSHLGEPHFFRPFRDTRFHQGPPIKEEVGVAIMPGSGAAYYFQLSLDGLMLGAGIHRAQPDQLERFRTTILDERRATSFEAALEPALNKGFKTAEPELKRVPRGFSPDHPRAARLRMKSLTVYKHHELTPWLHTPECDLAVRSELESTRLMVDWLGETVGPSAGERGR